MLVLAMVHVHNAVQRASAASRLERSAASFRYRQQACQPAVCLLHSRPALRDAPGWTCSLV